MKKRFLFLLAGLAAGAAYGQEARLNNVINDASRNHVSVVAAVRDRPEQEVVPTPVADPHRTTTTSPRWYNYAQYQDTALSLPGPNNSGGTFAYLWYSDNAIFSYASGPGVNNQVSVGTIFDPAASGFSNLLYYPAGIMAISNTTTYTVDSVSLVGIYKRNPAKPASIVDTIRLAYTFGPRGGTTSNIASYKTWGYMATYGVDTLNFLTCYFDSANNKATQVTGGTTPVYVQDVYLTQSDTTGIYAKAILLTTPLVVPAGNKVGLSLTFKSGDPAAYPAATFADTVFRGTSSSVPYKYGEYRQHFIYNNTGGTIGRPNYGAPADWNIGLTQLEPTGRGAGQVIYLPSYWITSGSGTPTTSQYADIGFHVQCPSCRVTGDATLALDDVSATSAIAAYPNPAADQLTISYTLSAVTNGTITLNNILGQQVDQKTVSGPKGTVILNTSDLADGLYTYTLHTSNGDRGTGKVVISH